MRILGVVSSSSREVPNAPTIGTATDVGTSRAYNNGAATVTFTAPTWTGGLPITSYTVTSSPGGFTGTGSASPITVAGLQSNTAYTFTVRATNAVGQSSASAASNSITATTVPQAPTVSAANVGTGRAFNNGAATVTVSGGATGGKAISSYTATSSPGSFTASGGSPLTVTGLASSTAYTFSVTATNANGTSTATVSNSITATTVPQAPTIGTATAGDANASVTFSANANGGSGITGYTVTSSPGGITGTGAGSPITVSGLTNGTAYTFTVTATNANGTSAASAASNSVTPVAPANFVALGYLASVAASSADGVTWTSRTCPYNIHHGAVWGGNKYIVPVGGSETNSYIWSSDGITWTQRNDFPGAGATYRISAYGNGLFVILAYNQLSVVTSTDGFTWTQSTLPAAGFWDMTYGNGLFVTGQVGSKNAYVSSNGTTWTAYQVDASLNRSFSGIAYGAGNYAIGTNNSNFGAWSSDAVSWNPATRPASNGATTMVFGNSTFVSGYSGTVAATSSNGITWTARTLSSSIQLNITSGVSAFSNGLFALLDTTAGQNRVLTSSDGISWTTRTLPTTDGQAWYTIAGRS